MGLEHLTGLCVAFYVKILRIIEAKLLNYPYNFLFVIFILYLRNKFYFVIRILYFMFICFHEIFSFGKMLTIKKP